MKLKPHKKFTRLQVLHILNNMHLTNRKLAFDTKLSREQVTSIYKMYGLKKMNLGEDDKTKYKGKFVKGGEHPRKKPIGYISKRADGYSYKKTEQGWVRLKSPTIKQG